MPVDPAFFALITAGMFCGALVNAFAGFAFSPVAAVFLIAVLPSSTLIPTLMMCSVLVQLAILVRFRVSLLAARSDAMLLGGVLGVPIAVALLPVIPVETFRVGFGAFLACYAIVMLRGSPSRPAAPRSARQEVAAGFLGGLIGGLTAMPSAVPVMYCDAKGLTKRHQYAIIHPFILVMQIVGLALLATTGHVNTEVMLNVALSVPALLLGLCVGLALLGRVPDGSFRRAVLLLLLATGVSAAADEDVLAGVFGTTVPAALAAAQ